MTTLSENKERTWRVGNINGLPVIAADIIYRGAAVGDNGSGYMRPLVAGDPFRGFAESKVDNSDGSAGDANVQLWESGVIKLPVTGASAVTDVGSRVYASDDDTFTLTEGANSYIGRVTRWISSTTCEVYFNSNEAQAESITLEQIEDLSRGSLWSGQGATNRPAELDASGDGYLLIGDGTDINSVASSGDVTVDNTGAFTIGAGVVETAMVADNDITTAKSADGNSTKTLTVTTEVAAGNETISASELLGGLILRDPSGGARTDTTDTAANIVAAMDDPAVGDSLEIVIRNDADAAETITIAGGSGVTTSGTMTIAQNNSKIFKLRIDNVTASSEAATLYSIGTLVH